MTCKICKWANHPPCPKNIPCCDCHDECNSRQCVEEPTKVCSKCGRELPLTDFYRNKKGYRTECKHCSIERTMHQRKGEQHQVKHHIVMHSQAEQPKPRKPRVANGNGDRSEYMHQYYLDNKEKLTAKNRADQLRRAELKRAASVAKVEKGCQLCANYPCFDGIENLESDFANEGCHAFRKREEEK